METSPALRPQSRSAFTLIEVLVVLAIIGLIGALGVPNIIRARNTAQTKACLENLNRLEGVKQQWGAEQKKSQTDIPAESDIAPYLKKTAICPSGGNYSLNALGIKATCTIAGHSL